MKAINCMVSLPSLLLSPPLSPLPLQSTLSEKVSAADIASLMPSSDGDEAGSLMPKLIELQTKINQLEGIMQHYTISHINPYIIVINTGGLVHVHVLHVHFCNCE